MATSTTPGRQARLADDYGVVRYELGDLLRRSRSGRSVKVSLTECPLCASDPERPRHHFQTGENRATHFETAHTAADV